VKKFLLAALFTSAVAVTVAMAKPAAAGELVSNGGFESPYGLNQGWDYSVSDTLDVFEQTSAAHSGDRFLIFTAVNATFADFISQTLDTVVGETYTYSYWLKGSTTDHTSDSNFHGTIGSQSIGYMNFSYPFDWTEFSGSYVATSTQTEITFAGFNSAGYYLLDDVSVTGPLAGEIDLPGGGVGAVPEPQTWALMLMGFAAVGAAVRRRRAGGLTVAA
jgi:hypothetical protein